MCHRNFSDRKCKKDAGRDLWLGSENEGIFAAVVKKSRETATSFKLLFPLVATASPYFKTYVAGEALFNDNPESETEPSIGQSQRSTVKSFGHLCKRRQELK